MLLSCKRVSLLVPGITVILVHPEEWLMKLWRSHKPQNCNVIKVSKNSYGLHVLGDKKDI